MTRSPRGFTLIELMVALVVSSLLVGMILAIFSRMSLAYRGQQQIAGVQQVLAAARATIELDAKQAGLALSQGFKFALDGAAPAPRSAVRVINSSVGPDQVYFYYADTTTQAVVTVAPPDLASWAASHEVTVDSTSGFAIDNLVVMSKVDVATAGVDVADANIATYDACILRISGIGAGSPGTLTFDNSPPWGRLSSDHCTLPTASSTMIYLFAARGYRIDPTVGREALGVLQQSPVGGLTGTVADKWTDLAYGFTDIQTALRVFDRNYDGADSTDPDIDGLRDWYSSDLQTDLTVPGFVLPGLDGFLQISISLVARTDRDVEGIATAATPPLIDLANPDHNTTGDRPSVSLPSATDLALQGNKIYRFTTFQVDLRNLGVGR